MDWELRIRYGNKTHILPAEIVYESLQIMRIKVHGKESYVLLETNYPFILSQGSKKAINWKIRECGFLNSDKPEDMTLLAQIMSELEYQMKGKAQNLLARIEHLKKKP